MNTSTPGTLCIRADADSHMGMGHVMRCLALAQAWQDHGGKVCLISAMKLPAVAEKMEREQVEIVAMGAVANSGADLTFTIAQAQQRGARWIVIDGYHFDRDYMLGIQQTGLHLLLLDDVADRELSGVEAILNQNAYAHEGMYTHFDPRPQLLPGCRYTLLRREFLTRREKKSIAPNGRRMLITMGGSDSPNITLLAMRALPLIKSLRLEVRIIVGTANLNLPALHEELPRLQIAHEAEILVNPPDMPGQMAWSDVTLTAAGSSCWELCCLGVPQLVLETANVQRMMSPYFVEHDIAEVMGVINEERLGELAARLERLLADAPKRARLSQASMGIIDGQGAMRVVDFMLGRA